MVETAAIVDRVSKALGVPPDEIVRKGVKEFLEAQLRMCSAEIYELKARYMVKNAGELEEKIRSGSVPEHPAWEELIVLENLEKRASKIRRELKALKQ
ncbi:MAG: hypothetical protein QXL91_04335 [Candidatus Bathyarchaeia archaeon]